MRPPKLTIPRILLVTSILGILTGFIGGVAYRDENPGENQLQVKLEMMKAIQIAAEQRAIADCRCGRCHEG